MTVLNIATWAQRKGLDLLGTGDCLQADWLREIECSMIDAEPGLLMLRPDVAATAEKPLSRRLRRQLRFVLSTEVCCAPPGTPELGGLHHLIYFPSLESARRFRSRMEPFGDLREGRPVLSLDSRQLLDAVLGHGDDLRLAPAHLFNPWYSSLGSVSGGRTLQDVFGDGVSKLTAVEMGLTSTPLMCRRVSSLDRHALFCCSDAHSLENLGREYTVVEIEPSFTTLLDTLGAQAAGHIRGLVKFPVARALYYRNRCGVCQSSADGSKCPRCGRALAIGSRDRLEAVADRAGPKVTTDAPPCRQLFPLAFLISELIGVERNSKAVRAHYERLIEAVGDERHILNDATQEEIAEVGTLQLARRIVAQRASVGEFRPEKVEARDDRQMAFEM